jgi:hypothetical protein
MGDDREIAGQLGGHGRWKGGGAGQRKHEFADKALKIKRGQRTHRRRVGKRPPCNVRLALIWELCQFRAMDDPLANDARFADLAKVRLARMMSEEERVLAGPRLFAGVCERMKEGLRDEQPDASEEEIHRKLLQRLARLKKLEPTRQAIP